MGLPLGESIGSFAEDLGMRPIDLLQVYRVILVVEGSHDSAVLQSTFPDEWESNRIRIVHMRGASHVLDLASSELLRDFTDAHIVVLLDDVAGQITEGIAKAISLAMSGSSGEARKLLVDLESRSGHIEGKAVQLARNYLKRPQNIHIRGLERRDIIEYLDPSEFGLTSTWKALRKMHREERHALEFKEWLRAEHGATINENRIANAAARLSEHPPPELTSLLSFCVGLSRGDYERS